MRHANEYHYGQLLEDEQDSLKEIDDLEEEISSLQERLDKQKQANANLLKQLQSMIDQ